MLNFNGLKFAKNEKELVDSLFTAGGTANGLYKRLKRHTLLYKPGGELFACIIHNHKQGYFVVSASEREGKPFFMYALCSDDERYLGLASIPLCKQEQMIRNQFIRDCD